MEYNTSSRCGYDSIYVRGHRLLHKSVRMRACDYAGTNMMIKMGGETKSEKARCRSALNLVATRGVRKPRLLRTLDGGRTCLCFGFLEQMTYTLPFLFTTLHPSHMTFTDARTFIPLARTTFADGAAESP